MDVQSRNLRDFAALVHEMRLKQREFYRTRTPTALEAAKSHEKRVDQAIRDILSNGRQGVLFDAPGAEPPAGQSVFPKWRPTHEKS